MRTLLMYALGGGTALVAHYGFGNVGDMVVLLAAAIIIPWARNGERECERALASKDDALCAAIMERDQQFWRGLGRALVWAGVLCLVAVFVLLFVTYPVKVPR